MPATHADMLRSFAERICQGESPLYEHLCRLTADDADLLRIVQSAPASQPAPNLFLAVIHFLLLSGADHELVAFYATCTEHPGPPEESFAPFRDFCLRNEAAVSELMAHRRVQTNEVRRCSYLLPAFCHVARQAAGQPLALIEVGASAGLNLIWDRYAYGYGDSELSPAGATVRITAELRGERGIPMPDRLPEVVHRVGLDLHVIDATDPTEALWLRSLVWPDQLPRHQLLASAIETLRSDPPDLVQGDALDLLPSLIQHAPDCGALCVFHCHTLNQFSDRQRDRFHALLAEASTHRPLVQLSAEWIRTPTPELTATRWQAGHGVTQHLAHVDQHGRWIEWLADLR